MRHLLAGAAALVLAATPGLAAEVGPTVQAIKDRGSLLCTGHNGSYLGFAEVDESVKWSGFDFEFCMALATAVLGSPDALQIIPVSWAQRFPALQSGDIDVIIKVTGWTMSRDTELGLQFSRPYFIGPTNILVRSDLGAETAEDLEGGVFCINAGTSIERITADYMGAKGIEYESLTFDKPEELRSALYNGRCDALAGFGPFLAATRFNAPTPMISRSWTRCWRWSRRRSRHARATTTGSTSSTGWSTRCCFAEENGITSENIDEVKANPPSASVERFLGVSPGYGERLGLPDDWAYTMIKGKWGTTPRSTSAPSARARPTSCRVARTICGTMAASSTRWCSTSRVLRALRNRRVRGVAASGRHPCRGRRAGGDVRHHRAREPSQSGYRDRLRLPRPLDRLADQLRPHRRVGPLAYWRVLLAGFLNTLLVGVLGIIGATIIGTVIGLARISSKPHAESHRHRLCGNLPQRAADPAGHLLVRAADASAAAEASL
ncbi:MAG: hypothetical protein AcusKO_14960 [Acuticoccus sp.]